MATYAYHTAQIVETLNLVPHGSTVVVDLNCWIGLQALDRFAPVEFHSWGIDTCSLTGEETERVVLSAKDGFREWSRSGIMDDVHMANAVRMERSAGTRMAIAGGMMLRGFNSTEVKDAYRAACRR